MSINLSMFLSMPPTSVNRTTSRVKISSSLDNSNY